MTTSLWPLVNITHWVIVPAHYHMLYLTVILAKQFMFTQRLAFSILLQLLLLLPPLVTAVSICILVMAKLEQMNWQCQNICLH